MARALFLSVAVLLEMRPLLILAGLLVCASSGLASSITQLRDQWASAHGGTCNVRLADGSRADIVTAKNAVDVVIAERWQESIGRALNQALQAGKRAGILMVLESGKDRSYLDRLNFVIGVYELPIDVWTTESGSAPGNTSK